MRSFVQVTQGQPGESPPIFEHLRGSWRNCRVLRTNNHTLMTRLISIASLPVLARSGGQECLQTHCLLGQGHLRTELPCFGVRLLKSLCGQVCVYFSANSSFSQPLAVQYTAAVWLTPLLAQLHKASAAPGCDCLVGLSYGFVAGLQQTLREKPQ